jgi:hypothetical protein
LGFMTFFTSRRRSRYSGFSRKLSLSLSITENFQSRTCRSESWGVDCAPSPADRQTRVETLQPDIVLHRMISSCSLESYERLPRQPEHLWLLGFSLSWVYLANFDCYAPRK